MSDLSGILIKVPSDVDIEEFASSIASEMTSSVDWMCKLTCIVHKRMRNHKEVREAVRKKFIDSFLEQHHKSMIDDAAQFMADVVLFARDETEYILGVRARP